MSANIVAEIFNAVISNSFTAVKDDLFKDMMSKGEIPSEI